MTTPTVAVHEGTYAADEPFLGAARYADGSILLIAHRTPPWAPQTSGPIAYRTSKTNPGWSCVWALPKALEDFVVTQPVGAIGKVSNRRVETIDLATAVPTGRINIPVGIGCDTWVGY